MAEVGDEMALWCCNLPNFIFNAEKIKALEEQKANLNPLERLQGVGAEIDEQIEFLKTGETAQYGKKFNKGWKVDQIGIKWHQADFVTNLDKFELVVAFTK